VRQVFRLAGAVVVVLLSLLLSGSIDPRRGLLVGEIGPGALTSPGTEGVAYVPPVVMDGDTVLVMLTTNYGIAGGAHEHSEFDAYYALADTVINLEDAAQKFAYVTIDQTQSSAGSYTFDASGSSYLINDIMLAGAETGVDNWDINSGGRRHMLLYYPFEDLIPANAQIIYAKIKAHTRNSTQYVGKSDSLVVNVFSSPGDSIWYTSKGTDYGTYDLPCLSHATWDNQIQALGVNDYPASGTTDWTFEWDNIEHYWELGKYCDWMGAPVYDTQPARSEFDIKITNCVQAIVSGDAINNGLLLHYYDTFNGANDILGFQGWGGVSGHAVYRPFMLIKYVRTPYTAPMPDGADMAFVFTAYDGIRPSGMVVGDLFAEHGAAVTYYVPGRQTYTAKGALAAGGHPFLDEGTQVYFDFEDLLHLYNQGHEIGSHTLMNNGLANNRVTGTGYQGLLFWEAGGDSIDAAQVPGKTLWPLTCKRTGCSMGCLILRALIFLELCDMATASALRAADLGLILSMLLLMPAGTF